APKTSAAPAPTEPRRPAPRAPRDAPSSRYVVLAVDDVHIESHNLLRIKKTLERFLERDMGEQDRFALVTMSGSRQHEFTDDRQALQKAIARLSVQDRKPKWVGAPYMSEYQAEQIALGDPEALRVAAEEIRNERLGSSPEQEARTFARSMLAESIQNARITLETLDGVVRGLSGLRGRKVLVLVSDGFLTGLRVQGGVGFDIRRIIDAGTRAGVIIYSLDSRGLVASSPGVAAASRMPVTASTFGARMEMERQSELAVHDAMGALADDTGGFLVANTNDLGSGLRKILKDTETYYLIAYEPTNPRRDGAFRKIEVRLPGLRDARIRHRKGYFAPDDRRASRRTGPNGPPPVAAEPATPPDARPESELNHALTSAAPIDGIPVRLSADFLSADGAALQVVVSGHVDLGAIGFEAVGDRHRATVDAAGAVFDETGALVRRLDPERAALDLTNVDYERARESGLDYQKAAPVKPGRYEVRFAVRHDGEAKLGSASQWVEVPDLGQGTLTLSSLFLLKKETSLAGTTPATAGDSPSLRGAQAWRRFKRDESLYVQIFAYNPARDASGATDLVTETEIWRGGVKLAGTPAEPLSPGERGAPPVPHTRSIKLAPFAPGDYEVRIVVTDRRAGAMASRRAGFTVE
ncbi:MAG TPA: VWA domain-containing protein, partial [Vicinamibacteria bacterium]|nr:VWA domain-containing protein [Vicinamibacteria bacterium]